MDYLGVGREIMWTSGASEVMSVPQGLDGAIDGPQTMGGAMGGPQGMVGAMEGHRLLVSSLSLWPSTAAYLYFYLRV